MTVNESMTKVKDMSKKPFCEVAYDLTGVIELGSCLEKVLMGKLQVPPEGFRAQVSCESEQQGGIYK